MCLSRLYFDNFTMNSVNLRSEYLYFSCRVFVVLLIQSKRKNLVIKNYVNMQKFVNSGNPKIVSSYVSGISSHELHLTVLRCLFYPLTITSHRSAQIVQTSCNAHLSQSYVLGAKHQFLKCNLSIHENIRARARLRVDSRMSNDRFSISSLNISDLMKLKYFSLTKISLMWCGLNSVCWLVPRPLTNTSQ